MSWRTEKTFTCNKYVVTWASGGTSICTQAIVGKGRGEGDFALLRLDAGPKTVFPYSLAKEPRVGNALALQGPTGTSYLECEVKAREYAPPRVTHDCAHGKTPGMSGAPLFQIEGIAKKLIGIHVNRSPDKLEATLWPMTFLKLYQAGNAPGASPARQADSQYRECQTTFFKYLRSKGVSGTAYSDGFMKGASDYLKRTPGAFKDYEKSDFIPLHLRISGTCEKLAAGNPLGAGLIDVGDSCKEGNAEEKCWMSCCDGNSVRTDIATANKPGCTIYFGANPEAACKALLGKP